MCSCHFELDSFPKLKHLKKKNSDTDDINTCDFLDTVSAFTRLMYLA